VVDFNKRLAGKKAQKPVDPVALYETLDRAHDKGPLRPAQLAILDEWFKKRGSSRDLIVKLHTGQGKTLIGLLMLQSRLNDGKGPALYLCPNNFLIAQTCDQAKQFGILTCTAEDELPDEFLNGETILVASVQKLFNGLTKFKLHNRSLNVGTILMDDAHACADEIREACRIRISRTDSAYDALKALFSDDLERQGVGTFADLVEGVRDALLPVPYWAWHGREHEVAKILARQTDKKYIKFVWPILKDTLAHCQCVFSGEAVEIEPYIPPLNAFGTYASAPHRIFMSATVTDDAFLIKGLELEPNTVAKPLTYSKERWSGEKMVLLPSLIHEDLDRATIVSGYAKPAAARKSGVVTLTPSFARSRDWSAYGAVVADKGSLEVNIAALKGGNYEDTIVLVNRYDGIDLPDDACRVLIFDGRPYSEHLTDLHQEACRANSAATLMRTVRSIEQGMGRSVRGEKDYSAIVITGPDIVRLIRDKASRKFFSPQMAMQVEIGLEIAEMARQEIEDGGDPKTAFLKLVRQCLNRDDGWKAFYVEQMDGVKPPSVNKALLEVYKVELAAERLFEMGDYAGASTTLQGLLDSGKTLQTETAWYLQEMARYNYASNKSEYERLQVAAYTSNKLLLKPPFGVTVAKLTIVSQGRVDTVHQWVGNYEDYAQLDVAVSDILAKLVFGTRADKFEQALDELSRAIGFAGERPDKEWKEGPDNLWALDATNYILWECKSEVDTSRAEINKGEAEQMSRSAAWFDKHYPGSKVARIIIHPAGSVASAASFTYETQVMREAELKKLTKAVRAFFKSFEGLDFKSLSATHTQKLLNDHKLSVADILSGYSKRPKNLK